MLKLDLEKSEKPEIKLPASTGSEKKQGSSRKTSTSDLDYAKGFDCVDDNKLWEIFGNMQIPDLLAACWEICRHVKKQHLELDIEQCTSFKMEMSASRLYIVMWLI